MQAKEQLDNCRRTFTSPAEWLEEIAVADIEGSKLNGCSDSWLFDPEEIAVVKTQRIAVDSDLRSHLVDLFGEPYFNDLMQLYVDLSLREYSEQVLGLRKPDPSKPRRRVAWERPLLRQLILIQTFRSEPGIVGKLKRYADACRREDMAELVLSEMLWSGWAIVSPRTVRVIDSGDVWVVALPDRRSPHRHLSERDILQYMLNHAGTLFEEANSYLGIQREGEQFVLDVVKLFADLDEACTFARKIGQRLVTNLKSQQCLDLEFDAE